MYKGTATATAAFSCELQPNRRALIREDLLTRPGYSETVRRVNAEMKPSLVLRGIFNMVHNEECGGSCLFL